MKFLELLCCPVHKSNIKLDQSQEKYLCPAGCSFSIINGIPRFVSMDNYASSFGLQWNEYQKTQLDSFTGLPISKTRLKRLMGGSLDILKGKQVLEVGCGAGRFTEILLEAGSDVFATDISSAVEANYKNCNKYPDYFVCQADILKFPVKTEQFDIVICIGVIQHTPNPEQTITALCSQVKPGGLLIIDHYTYGYSTTPIRKIIRLFLIKMPTTFSLKFCKMLATMVWPIHKILWKYKTLFFIKKIRPIFLHLSPIVDYQDAYPELGPELLKTWATLDTHDTLTDYYKHLRSSEEVSQHLHKCGMVDVETTYAGNGVEARARKSTNERI